MSATVIPFPDRAPVTYGSQVTRHALEKTQVRRLGGVLHKYVCSCGIGIEAAEEQDVKDAFFLFHAERLGLFDEED